MNRNKGFTLIELIVVIAIIGVLAGVLLIAINPAALLAKGRDAKRLDDLDSLNKAISLSLADGEIALSDVAEPGGTQAVDGVNGWVRFTIPTGKTGLSKYISTLPQDPSNDAATGLVYSYASRDGVPAANGAAGYELNAVLESPDNTTKMSTDGGNDPARYEVGTILTLITPN